MWVRGIYVDDRWSGQHGIGRYAREVTARLNVAWQPMRLSGSPSSATDFFRPLPAHMRQGVIYSPGYNSFVRAKRQLVTVLDLIHLRSSWPGRLKYEAYYKGVLRPIVRREGVVITISETSKREIEEWLNDSDVRVVNAGIGLSSGYGPHVPEPDQGAPYAITVSNMREHKNVDVVLRAFKTVHDLRLKLVVPTTEREAAAKRMAFHGVQGRVDLLSQVDDENLAMLYKGARVTVFPSILEGFGLPALESLACGTPVVYYAGCDAVRETVGTSGIAVSSADDHMQWREAIVNAASGHIAVGDIRERYSYDRTAATISAVLREVADAE